MVKFQDMKSQLYAFCFLFFINIAFSQKADFNKASIPETLLQNSNAVIRSEQCEITIPSQRSMTIKTKRIVTVLNESGVSAIGAYENYDKNRKIKKVELTVFDAFGRELKSYKRRDFKDMSAGDGFSVFNDNRILYLNYTPIQYPFTVIYESEIETSNTAFIPTWSPFNGYFISTEKASLDIKYNPALGFRFKETNFSAKYNIIKNENEGQFSYTAQNIPALKGEDNSPEFIKIVPVTFFKVEKFNLEGVDGQAETWKDFGEWYYKSLLTGTDELPAETRNKIKQLVGNEKNPREIAKIVYKYVQDKTRYVSIQVGIGGFKPMLAKDVDKLGYGDCKGLSNYTRALLNVVGITAYNVIIYGDRYKRNIQSDFVSVQGNHMILAIPDGDDYIWLECTNQTSPFGYQGTFTDSRNALVIKPEGGEIVKTKAYTESDNSQITKGSYAISPEGNISGKMAIVSKGEQYDRVYGKVRLSKEDVDNYYKSYFNNINSLKLAKINFNDDPDAIAFTEEIELSAPNYASGNNDKLMFVLNAFNFNSYTPKRYRARENPFEINRGFYDYDEITIELPAGYSIEAMPQNSEIKTKYGEYETSIMKNDNNTITYKRTLSLKTGFYESKEYDDYRLFREQISRNDNAKIILTKKI